MAALATAGHGRRPLRCGDGGPTASAHLRAHAVTTVKIVSDLPLHGGDREQTLQMVHAIRFVLEQSGYKAGKYRIRFESHDDSIASTRRVGREPLRQQRALVRGRPDDRRRDRDVQLGLRGDRDPDPEPRRAGDGQPREHVPRAHQGGDRQRVRRARDLLPGRRAELHARRPLRRQRRSRRRGVHEAHAARDDACSCSTTAATTAAWRRDVRGRGEAARPADRGPRRLGPAAQELRRPDDADQGHRRRRALRRRRLRPQRRPPAPRQGGRARRQRQGRRSS